MPITDPWLPAGSSPPVVRPATPIAVFRYKPDEADPEDRLEEMPNLRCVAVQRREGADPGAAIFRYVFDGVSEDSPQSMEEAISTGFTGAKTVEIGDRLAVLAARPDEAT